MEYVLHDKATTIGPERERKARSRTGHPRLHHRRIRRVRPNIQRYIIGSTRPGVLVSEKSDELSSPARQHLSINWITRWKTHRYRSGR